MDDLCPCISICLCLCVFTSLNLQPSFWLAYHPIAQAVQMWNHEKTVKAAGSSPSSGQDRGAEHCEWASLEYPPVSGGSLDQMLNNLCAHNPESHEDCWYPWKWGWLSHYINYLQIAGFRKMLWFQKWVMEIKGQLQNIPGKSFHSNQSSS